MRIILKLNHLKIKCVINTEYKMGKKWSVEFNSATGGLPLQIRGKSLYQVADRYEEITGLKITHQQLRNVYWGRAPSRATYINVRKVIT